MGRRRTRNAKLTHFGRRSGKPYKITIWYAEIGGEVWIGSLDDERNWVRNCCAGPAEIDVGEGPKKVRCVPATPEEVERFREAILAKHPIAARIISAVSGRGATRCAFRCEPVD